MLLAIDLGNSHIVSGVFEGRHLVAVWRLSTDQTKTPDEYGVLYTSLMAAHRLQPDVISGCILSSVVPPLTLTFENMVESFFHQRPEVVSSDFPFDLTLCYDNPAEIGTDRLVNAAAGFERFHCCLIIVDFGTATTVCTITEKGEYLGGAIAPGLKSAGDSLHLQTAKLPMVDLVQPKMVIGTNTVTSMQSGLIYGYAGLVDELVTKIQYEIGKEAFVLATGGLASVIAPISRTIREVRPNLTLEGLELLHRRIQKRCG